MSITTAGWTLANIRTKMRNLVGEPSTDQMSDATANAYINDYYVFTMPEELKVQIQNNFLDFKTTPGVNVYSFPSGTFLTDSPGAYADGFPLIFYEDPDIFYQDWPQQYSVDSVGVGTDNQLTFTGTCQGFPLVIETFFITDGTQVINDIGIVSPDVYPNGTLSGPNGSGTINYATGEFSATFRTAPVSTATIYTKYQACQENRPQGVLFFEDEFTLFPVPDQVYQIRMQGFILPDQLVLDTDVPSQPEWGPLIAYGAALERFADRGDTENYDRYYAILKRQENIALSRTIQQYTPLQGVPRF